MKMSLLVAAALLALTGLADATVKTIKWNPAKDKNATATVQPGTKVFISTPHLVTVKRVFGLNHVPMKLVKTTKKTEKWGTTGFGIYTIYGNYSGKPVGTVELRAGFGPPVLPK